MKKLIKHIKNKGFVILFAVTVSAILLSITLGVASIALKEIKFGTSAKDTGEAFFAADTGIECALVNDKSATSLFPLPANPQPITCENTSIPVIFTDDGTVGPNTGTYTFVVTGLGSAGTNCAVVNVTKDDTTTPPYIKTTVVSKGYNTYTSSDCSSSNPDRVERQLEARY